MANNWGYKMVIYVIHLMPHKLENVIFLVYRRCYYIYILQIVLMKEGGTFTERITHTFIYVFHQEGRSPLGLGGGMMFYGKRHYVVFVYYIFCK